MAFSSRKLKRAPLINSTYTLNGTAHILQIVGESPIKVFHMSKPLALYPNFEFSSNDGDVSVDAPGDSSIQ